MLICNTLSSEIDIEIITMNILGYSSNYIFMYVYDWPTRESQLHCRTVNKYHWRKSVMRRYETDEFKDKRHRHLRWTRARWGISMVMHSKHRDASWNPEATCNSRRCTHLPFGYPISCKYSKYFRISEAPRGLRVDRNSGLTYRRGHSTKYIHARDVSFAFPRAVTRKMLAAADDAVKRLRVSRQLSR